MRTQMIITSRMQKLLFILLLITTYTFSQKGNVAGNIISNKEGVYSTIEITDTHQQSTSNFQGEYNIVLTAGKHIVLFSALGYKPQTKEVLIKPNQTTTLNIELKEDILGLDEVVVTATRGYLNRKKAPVIVTVTDAKILEATQSVSLSEGLNFQPGLRMENNCQNCGTAEVKMNGLGGSYSQILIDSRPVFSTLNAVYGLDQIPANIIKQIEVVRGGGSALYGSNAVAGTINIITKDPIESSFTVGTNLASINGKAIDASLLFNGTIVNDNFDSGLALFGLKRNREAYQHDNDGYSEITELEGINFGLKGFTRPNTHSKITAEFMANNEYRRGGDQLSALPYLANTTEEITSDIMTGGLTYEQISQNHLTTFSAYLSGSYSKNENFYGGVAGEELTPENIIKSTAGFGTSEDKTLVTGVQFAHKFKDHFKGTFTGGTEYKHNTIDDRKENPNYTPIAQTIKMLGIYAQQEWQINERLKLLGGLRADFHNLVDETMVINPRFNVLYNVNSNLRLRASYAKGFRAPQIYGEDVHAGLAAGEIGRILNADNLKSETSHSFLASVDWSKEASFGAISIVLETFYTRLQNAFTLEITEESLPNIFIYERRNSDGAKVYGLNLEAKYAPNEKWMIQASATVQEAEFDNLVFWSDYADDQATKKFNETPSIYGNFVLTYAPIKAFQNSLSSVYTGRMYVQHLDGFIERDQLEKVSDFFELNWKSSYKFKLNKDPKKFLEVSAGIQNLFSAYQNDFDQGFERDATYNYGPQRPRTFFIGAKIGM